MTPNEFLAAFTWRDALDFGLLFVITYGLVRAVRRTRAVPVLLAVGSLGLMAWMARALDLIGVATLLRYFFDYVIILLIVAFHQELRRLLLYVGQRLLPAGRRRAARSAVEELLAGLERLGKARVGALVVLPGEIDVLEVASDRGREVGAPLRADTLVALAIPHPANPGHDGALLIKGFKIDRVAVICPLTSADGLDPHLGTRHRGAIGVTEETDALAIVLSEERGELRLAQGGRLSAPLDIHQLEARITTWLERPRAEATRRVSDARTDSSDHEAGHSRTDLVDDAAPPPSREKTGAP